MRKILVLMVVILCCEYLNAQNLRNDLLIDNSGINNFLSISPSKKIILYSKNLKDFESGDYVEGQIYIHNETQKSQLLSKDTFEISTIHFQWGKDDKTLYFYNGKGIFYISIEDKIEVKPLFVPMSKYERIDNFFISNSGSQIICWITNNNPENSTKDLVIFDIESSSFSTVYSVRNKWVNEYIETKVVWANDDKSIFFINMYGSLFRKDLQSAETVMLSENVEYNKLMIYDNLLYYCKSNKLILFNIDNNKEQEILNSKFLNVNYLTINPDKSLIISFNDKIIYYNGNDSVVETLYSVPLESKIVYCDQEFFISEDKIDSKNQKITLNYYK